MRLQVFFLLPIFLPKVILSDVKGHFGNEASQFHRFSNRGEIPQEPEICLLREIVHEVLLVSEDDVRATIRRLALGNRLIVEGSAALPVAAALATPAGRRGRAVAVVTGASIDTEKLLAILG